MPGEACPIQFSSQPSQMLRIRPKLSRIQNALQQEKNQSSLDDASPKRDDGIAASQSDIHWHRPANGGASTPTE